MIKPLLARQKLGRIPGRDPPGDSTQFLPSKKGFNHVLGPWEKLLGSIFVNDLEALSDALSALRYANQTKLVEALTV